MRLDGSSVLKPRRPNCWTKSAPAQQFRETSYEMPEHLKFPPNRKRGKNFPLSPISLIMPVFKVSLGRALQVQKTLLLRRICTEFVRESCYMLQHFVRPLFFVIQVALFMCSPDIDGVP